MKRLLLLTLLVVFAVPAQAHAAMPCRNKIFNDWYGDGKIASTYSHACYVDALQHIPPDANEYSSLREDISAAMRAAALQQTGKVVPKEVGHGFTSHNVLVNSPTQSKTPHAQTTPTSHDPSTGEKNASGAELASSSSGTPLPVLVLGGVALALVAAGGVGAGVRRSRSRRG